MLQLRLIMMKGGETSQSRASRRNIRAEMSHASDVDSAHDSGAASIIGHSMLGHPWI